MPFTPEQEQRMREIYQEEFGRMFSEFITPGAYVSHKDFKMLDGKNIILGRTTGTKIGTNTDEKLAFFGGTPVLRQSAVTPPSGGAVIDSQARTAINSLIAIFQAFNFTA